MKWRFEIITTEIDGEVINRQEFPPVYGNFDIEQTLGDEFFIKSGDINIQTKKAITIDVSGGRTNYLIVYLNGELFDAYIIPREYDELDQKTKKYKAKYFGVQKKFYDDLKSVIVAYATDLDLYNDAVEDAAFDMIYTISSGPQNKEGTGFSLGALLTGLATNKKSNGFGYRINSISYPGSIGETDDVAILHMNSPAHVPSETTLTDLIDSTFGIGTGEGASDINVSNWLGLFKLASFIFNGWIWAKPVIFSESGMLYLGLDVSIVPRVEISPANTKQSHWISRTQFKDKYRIDGVVIWRSSSVPYYIQGDINSNNIFEKTAPFDNTLQIMPASPTTDYLNLSPGDWDAGNLRYDIRESSGSPPPNRDWVNDGFIEPYFDNLIGSGHGYEGKIYYNGEQILDHLEVLTEGIIHYIQINKLTLNGKSHILDVEGFTLNA